MRLLYTTSDGNFRFTKDIIRAEEIPPYAILSHTWGDQEVVFDDVRTYDAKEIETEKQGGWEKIRFCARQAKLDGLEHFWVDTCCIDKTNNTELSEAINSMFRWYQNSHKCYVYLPDIQSKSSAEDSRPSSEWKAAFRANRWFTRGWTLQELVAPGSVEFFSADGARLGDKDSLKQTIHEVTGIPIEALSSSDMSKFDVSERFTWAEHRQTTREEDGAYCLLGIVGCYLPLIYGEGKKNALNRLRKEMQGREEKLSQIRSWLSAPDPAMNYLKAHKQRQAGTGLWLLQNENFREWKENAASRLWLYGIPGCGKTILSSTVVEHLQHHCGDDKRKVTVYFYFDFNDAQKQIPELMLRSLLRQLLQHTVTIPRCVDELFSSCGDGQQQPPLHKLLTVIPEVMRQFSHVYVVLDALDESAKRAELMEMLATVAGWQLDVSHLLMTSRKERDIEMCLDTFVVEDNMICLQRDVVDEDILRFVQQKLCDDKRLAKWNKNAEVRQEIKTALMRGAQGMFRWATCQLDVIAECRNLSVLRKSLATLPQTLDQTYDRILTAISEKDRMYTIRILQWLTFSARPLSLEEVAEVVAIDVAREPAFDRDEVLADPLEALEICSSLVTTVKEEPTWRSKHGRQIVILAHYSVQEYLVSERIRQGPAKQYSMKEIECHKAMTIGCLGYLNQFQEPLTDEIYYVSALAYYSARFWSDHLQKTGDGEDEISRLAVRLLLTDKHVFANFFRIYDPETGDSYEVHDSDEPYPPPIYYISALGLNKLVKILLDQDVDVNAEGGMNGSALFAAVSQGHLAVVELLVNAKADVYIQDCEGEYPLAEALRNGNKAIVKALIHAGADVNMANNERLYPIQSASELGDKTLVKVLIDAGADVNGRHGTGNDALLIALRGGNKAIATLLIDAGADANSRDKHDCTALQIASSNGDEEVVRMLIKVGAVVNDSGNELFGNALLVAAEGGHTTVVELLLDEGAEINAQDSMWDSALHGAVRSSQERTVEVLLRRGANVFPTNGTGINVLHLAAQIKKHHIVVALLESKQAKAATLITSKDKHGRNVLHHMFWADWHEVKTVEWLLDHGADGSELDNFGISPLAQYLKSPSPTLDVGICRSLLDTKEAASFAGHEGQTLGHLCAKRFHFEVLLFKVLSEGGVDLTKKDCRGRTILHYAVFYNTLTEQMLRYFITVVGIKADEKDEHGRTALQYAIEKANAYRGRNLQAFKRFGDIISLLSELQEREGLPLLAQSGSSTRLPNTSLPFSPNGNRMR